MVNPDAIRLALHGYAYITEAEGMIWTQAKYMVKSLFLAGHDKVVVDATNTTIGRRGEWEPIAESVEAKIRCQLFLASPGLCKERAIIDGREELLPVIDRMDETFNLEGVFE
jgi:predicted kinase